MVRGSSCGRLMELVREHDLRGHVQRLREIFNRRLEPKHGDTYRLTTIPSFGNSINIGLEKNSCTSEVSGDRAAPEICGVLADTGSRRVLCSFLEGWSRKGKERFQFEKAAFSFFLEFEQDDGLAAKQVFRLEWDNWKVQNSPNSAAYPHWQFDRWLTASDAQQLDQLKNSLATPTQQEVVVFQSAKQQALADGQRARYDRPDLIWFTRLHFPAIAPWATDPIRHSDADPKRDPSHRSLPRNITELEDWIESALRYLKTELIAYA